MTISNEAVETITNGSPQDCIPILDKFNINNEKQINFPQIENNLKSNFWDAIFSRIQSPSSTPEVIRVLLHTLRILSREKSTLEAVMTKQRVDILLQVSKLKESSQYENTSDQETLEGLKVVYNMVFQSAMLRTMFLEDELVLRLVTKIKHFRSSEPGVTLDVQFFVMRILFIITALTQETIYKVRRDVKGVIYIVEYLESLTLDDRVYDDMTVDIVCDTLKVLYNLFHMSPSNTQLGVAVDMPDEEELCHLNKVTQLIRMFLLHQTKSPSKKDELQNHSVNLLTVMPNDCFEELIPPIGTNSLICLDGKDLSAVSVIVDFLKHRIFHPDGTLSVMQALYPVLTALIRMSGHNINIRKFLKQEILPPLKKSDVVEKPEVGNTLRNKLCAFLTSPAGNIAELVANFLFLLCNENVKKLIKYTGYGNAAGLLANKGLLLGDRLSSQDDSSDSSNSDTEEYKEVRHLVNEVEGWIQPERPHGCEGMTDEQKEYEAMKLVQAIEMLNRSNIITPCRIGPDGRPEALDHVLQLQDGIATSYRGDDDEYDNE